MGAGAYLREGSGEEQGWRAVHSPRRPSVCERPHSYRTRLQQDPQRLRAEEPCPARLLRALHSRLGLPRPAHRAHGGNHPRPREDGCHRPAYAAPPVPRMGREVRGHPARGFQAPRRQRRLGAPLPHVPAELRVGQRRNLQGNVPERLGVSRSQAHRLVQALPHRLGRGRDRVLGRDVAVPVRSLRDDLHARATLPKSAPRARPGFSIWTTTASGRFPPTPRCALLPRPIT